MRAGASGFLLMALGAISAHAQPPMPDSRELRECASCHIQWIHAFDRPEAILLMEKPIRPMEAEAGARVIVALAVGLLIQGLFDPQGSDWVTASEESIQILLKGLESR